MYNFVPLAYTSEQNNIITSSQYNNFISTITTSWVFHKSAEVVLMSAYDVGYHNNIVKLYIQA